MAPSKAPKKQQKRRRSVDFKKTERKIKKSPPPQNEPNTEIKSKEIVLLEQNVAAEKKSLAVNSKGLTLEELLQQTSHHNSNVRRDALRGVKDLFFKHPEELSSQLYVVIGKLRELISDDDNLVRETLYRLFKSVIFPGCNQDNVGALISLMMENIFLAMTNYAIDVRLMAFKFFDLVVQQSPRCIFLYAEKALQNYEDTLRQNRFYVEDKRKLNTALWWLVHCLLHLINTEPEREETAAKRTVLRANELDAPKEGSVSIERLKELVRVLIGCYQEFSPLIDSLSELDKQSFHCILLIVLSIDIAIDFSISCNLKETPQAEFLQGVPNHIMHDRVFLSVLQTKLLAIFPQKKKGDRFFILNILISKIFLQLREWISPPASLLETYLEFIEKALLQKIRIDTELGEPIWEEALPSLLPLIPKLVSQIDSHWQVRLVKAFTRTFKNCKPESELKLACLSAIEKLLVRSAENLDIDINDPAVADYYNSWLNELPPLLNILGDEHPSTSVVALRILLGLIRR